MSELSELKDEIRRLREEVALLRLSQPAVQYPVYVPQPYYVPVYPQYTPYLAPPRPIHWYSECLQGGNAQSLLASNSLNANSLAQNGYAQ